MRTPTTAMLLLAGALAGCSVAHAATPGATAPSSRGAPVNTVDAGAAPSDPPADPPTQPALRLPAPPPARTPGGTLGPVGGGPPAPIVDAGLQPL